MNANQPLHISEKVQEVQRLRKFNNTTKESAEKLTVKQNSKVS